MSRARNRHVPPIKDLIEPGPGWPRFLRGWGCGLSRCEVDGMRRRRGDPLRLMCCPLKKSRLRRRLPTGSDEVRGLGAGGLRARNTSRQTRRRGTAGVSMGRAYEASRYRSPVGFDPTG